MIKMLFIVISSLLFFSACNTIAGAGQDIQAGGHAITTAADDVKNKM